DGRLMVAAAGLGEPRMFVPEGDLSQGRFVAVTGEDRLQFAFDDGRAVRIETSSNGALLERAGAMKQPLLLGLLALLTALAAIATLAGIVRRMRREHRESQVQSRASLIQNTQALLWLISLGLFGAWVAQA